MKVTLIELAKVFVFVVLLLSNPQAASSAVRRKSNLQFYTVSMPIGYGALSAYHALPSALPHAPYALRGLSSSFMSSKIGSVRTLDFDVDEEAKSASSDEMSRPNYSLDLETFVRLFAHEFHDHKNSER